ENETMGRDPIYGQLKRLEVEYSYGNGVIKNVSKPEHARFILPEELEAEVSRLAATATQNAYGVTIFVHDDALVSSRLLVRQVQTLFQGAGWQVENGRTNLPQHAEGVWLRGGTPAEQASASWGLRVLGTGQPRIDDHGDSPRRL